MKFVRISILSSLSSTLSWIGVVLAQDGITFSKSISLGCSESGIAQCDAQQRLCLVNSTNDNEEEQEFCGPCVLGFVEFPETIIENITASTSQSTRTNQNNDEVSLVCIEISKLKLGRFLDHFQPLLLDSGNTTVRLQMLLEAARFVSEFNREFWNATFDLAINEFATDNNEEKQGLTGYQPPEDGDDEPLDNIFHVPESDESVPYPSYVNWVQQGAVTPVKNQGRCGCCWAISTVGAVEGAAAISSNFTYLESLSHQQLISCDLNHQGCEGGFPRRAFDYVDDVGMATLEDYPFTDQETGETSKECTLKGKPVAVDTGSGYLVNWYGEVGDDSYTTRVERLKYALAKGPVAISIKSSCYYMQLYRRGILTKDGDCKCSPADGPCQDHAVLAVGFNDRANPPYWLIKNSWGTRWGEGGFFRVAQLNPDSTEESYGLFGVLSEGIIATDGYVETSGRVFDKNATRPLWWKVMVSLVVILAFCILVLMALSLKNQCFPKKDGSQ